MIGFTRRAFAVLALLSTGLFASAPVSPAAASSVTTQAPCVGSNGYCLKFAAADPIPVIRGIKFKAPKAGTAQVTFHGTVYCAGGGVKGGDINYYSRMDLISQIVKKKSAVPEQGGPGGLRHAASMSEPNLYEWSTTFNLGSTRTFTIKAAGKQQYYFKIARLLQETSVTCYVYNASFSVAFD